MDADSFKQRAKQTDELISALESTLKSLVHYKCKKYRYEVVYYAFKNRGNFVRLLFEEAGVPYDDICDLNKVMSYFACGQKLSPSNSQKLKCDMFAPPAVIRYPLDKNSKEDIIAISQTAAIVSFLSTEFNLRPATLENFYKSQMLVANANDILTEIFNHRNDTERDLNRFFATRMQIWLDILQKPLTISKTQKYYFDNRCLAVDIAIYNICEGIADIMDARKKELFIDTHSILYRHFTLIKNRESIKKCVDRQNKEEYKWWPSHLGFDECRERLNGRERKEEEKEKVMFGGWGKEANKQELAAAANAVKPEVEKQAKDNGKAMKCYEVQQGKQQIVAGINYKIKIKIDENRFCEIMVHKSLPPISYQLKSVTFMLY